MPPLPKPEEHLLVCQFEPHHHMNIADSAKWCSLCNDFEEYLILCAGCRVGMCSMSSESNIGCLIWSSLVNDEDFVYYCPFCTKRTKVGGVVCILKVISCSNLTSCPQLPLHKEVPHKKRIWFQYDPAVLIVAATWPQTKDPFISYLHHVRNMDFSLDFSLLFNIVSLCFTFPML